MAAINLLPLPAPDELSRLYDRRYGQQDTYLEINLEAGAVTCAHGGKDMPKAIHRRRRLRFSLPSLTADAAYQLFSEAVPLAERVLDGAAIEWDGNNRVGVLDPDASAAEAALKALIDTYASAPTVQHVDVAVWYSERDRPAVTADLTDAELATLATEVKKEIRQNADGVVVPVGASEYLTGLRARLRADVDEELLSITVERKALIAERDPLLHRLHHGNKMSPRRLGEVAEMNAQDVRRIAMLEGTRRRIDPAMIGVDQATADLARLAEIGPRIALLTLLRNELACRVRAWQDATRDHWYIAGLSGLSDTEIQHIAAKLAAK